MISIIIPVCQDKTYLTRCLNSIKKQSFQNYEVIVDTGLDEALLNCNGTKVFFMSASSVLATGTLEQMDRECNKENPVVSGKLLFSQEKRYVEKKESLFSVCGKLFHKEFITKNNLTFGNNDVSDGSFMVEAIACMKVFPTMLDEAYVYESFQTVLPHTLQKEKMLTLLKICEYRGDSEDSVIWFIKGLLKGKPLFEEKKELVCGYAALKKEDYESNYILLRDYISEWYKQALIDRDNELFEAVKEFLAIFEEDLDFSNLAFGELKINKEIYDCLKRNDVTSYLFFKDKISSNTELSNTEKKLLELQNKVTVLNEEQKKLKELIDKKQLQPVAKMPATKNEVVISKSSVSELTGPVLAEYVVETFANGRLGIKTIVKALIAWLKFKAGVTK